jgi:hypothetical protein
MLQPWGLSPSHFKLCTTNSTDGLNKKRRSINYFYVGIRRNHTRILAHRHHRDISTQQPWRQSKPPSQCYSRDMLHPINAIQLQNHRASPPCHHGSVAQLGDSIGIRREAPTSTRTTDEFSSISSASFDHRSLGPFNLRFLGVVENYSFLRSEGNLTRSSTLTSRKCSVVEMKMKRGTGSPNNDGAMIPRPPMQQTVLEASLKLIVIDRDCRWLDSSSQKWLQRTQSRAFNRQSTLTYIYTIDNTTYKQPRNNQSGGQDGRFNVRRNKQNQWAEYNSCLEGRKIQHSNIISTERHNNNSSDGDFGLLPDQKWSILLHSTYVSHHNTQLLSNLCSWGRKDGYDGHILCGFCTSQHPTICRLFTGPRS